jgi:hypothetical protein
MVTTTTSLLHDIEEYFADHNVKPGAYSRLNPTGLLRRAYEQLVELEADLHEAKRKAARNPPGTCCDCWRMLDDNDDS